MNSVYIILIIVLIIIYIITENEYFKLAHSTKVNTYIEISNSSLEDKAYFCNLVKNVNNQKANPLYYKTDGTPFDLLNTKNIQKDTYASIANVCKLTDLQKAGSPFYNFINCVGKGCDSYLSNGDKEMICQMFNYPSQKAKKLKPPKYPNPVDESSFISEEEHSKLNVLCNGPTNLKEFNTTTDNLQRYHFCKDNIHLKECTPLTAVELLEALKKNGNVRPSDQACPVWNEDKRISIFGYDKYKNNGSVCITQNNVLARDSINSSEYEQNIWGRKADCKIGEGKWNSPVENRILYNQRMIDIDHQVPLHNAYISGACKWNDLDISSIYGNDMTPGHLKAISYNMNRTKNDNSPDKWMPYKYRSEHLGTPLESEKSLHDCIYTADWIAVKYRYNLTLTQEEYDELFKIVTSSMCNPSEPIFKSLPIGFSHSIIKQDKRVMSYPLLTKSEYEYKRRMKTKWFDIVRDTTKTYKEKYLDLWKDISSNFTAFGVHNSKYFIDIHNKTVSKNTESEYKSRFDDLIAIVLA